MSPTLLDRASATKLESELREANLELARRSDVPDDIQKLVDRIAEDVMKMSPQEMTGIDPYLLLGLHQGVLLARYALDISTQSRKRTMLRIALEKMRQAARDVVEGIPTAEDQPAKEVARWLVDVLSVPQSDIADVLSVNARTFQRWISITDPAEPRNEDALKVRILARITQNLRHSFSGPGVLAWLERPHPELKGNSPKSLLSKHQNFEELVHLAAAARSSAAT